MDRGYANFAVTSTQVAIAPEKDDIFVTINVERRRSLQGFGSEDRRQSGRAGVGAAAADLHAARRHVFAARHHRDHRGHEVAPRRGRLRVRDHRPGAAGESGHQGNLADLRRRPEEPRVRAAREFQRHVGRERRSVPSRDAPARRRVSVELRSGAFQAAYPAPAVHRESRSRDEPGAGRGRPGRRRLRDRGGPAGPVRRRRRLLRVAVGDPERQLRALELHGHRQPHRRRDQLGPLCQGVQLLALGSLHDDRRSAALDLARLPRRHAVHLGGLGLRHRDDQPRHQLRLADQRVPVPRHRRHCAALRAGHHRGRQRGPGGRLGAQQRQPAQSPAARSRSTTTATIRSSSRS